MCMARLNPESTTSHHVAAGQQLFSLTPPMHTPSALLYVSCTYPLFIASLAHRASALLTVHGAVGFCGTRHAPMLS